MNNVTEFNAYKYSDNYTIQTESEPVSVIGCEHNQQEAKAVAAYYGSYHGRKMAVVKNSRSDVEAAKKFRPQPLRYQFRDEAFKACGVI